MKQRTGKYGYMKAADMFLHDAKQVFDRKTGQYICLELPGQEIKDLFTPEPMEDPKPEENQKQLQLF